ncbi:hypothetical protein HanIR_Chr02g0073901 [Helianthus annuus]|nr:hypothetical protein HanIR_Chr02g0073901 [Helianthus annuus]
MVWRQPEAVLNEPELSESELNSCFLDAIRKCPSRVRPFPENLLVLLGISKLWDKSNRDPVLMRDDQVMSALDFVKSDDTSDVVFADAEAAEGVDAVAKGSDQRFEGSGYVSIPNVKGFTKVPVPKVSTRRSNRRLLTDVDHPSGGVEKEKEKELVVAGKKKKLVKKGVVPAIQGSSGKSVEGLEESSADEVYVPNCSVKVGDSFKDPVICADVLANFAPPSVRDSIAEMEGDTMISRMILSSCNLSALLAEGVNRFHKGMQEYEDLMKKDRMKTSMASMKKEIGGFAQKEEAWVKKMHEVTSRHEVEVEGLKKELEALKDLKVFQDSVRDMEHMTRPFVGEVSGCFDKPHSVLQGLKPRGLNEVVCKKVMESLSKKRSCSGDSEETMSAGDEASKEGSLEASEAAGEGRKKKKAKKSKDDGAGASKPSSAGFDGNP